MDEKSEQRILVVDDEQAITDFVSFNLSKENYKVDVAHNGNEAVDMANANDYDLVILDVMLPGIDGYRGVPAASAPRATCPCCFYRHVIRSSTRSSGSNSAAMIT